MNLPAADIQGVRFRGGKMTYLSDLNPSKVEETPYFGHRLPWRRNVNLLGEPLKINGQTYDRGLAVHSRCDPDVRPGPASTRRSKPWSGLTRRAKGQGRVDCRVFADGKEIYSNPDLRADGPPVKLALPVAGAEQLRLHVDFGRGQDTGDRVIWANARLHRQAPSTASAATTPRTRSVMVSGISTTHEPVLRSIDLGCRSQSLCSCLPSCSAYQAKAKAVDDKPQSPIEVHEWSVWVGNPAQPAINASRIYKNAMPGVVGHEPAQARGEGAGRKFPLAPVSVVQFFGEPARTSTSTSR